MLIKVTMDKDQIKINDEINNKQVPRGVTLGACCFLHESALL